MRAATMPIAVLAALCLWGATLARAQSGVSAPGSSAIGVTASSDSKPVVLDSVIAVINGDVLLRSDLQSEMEMAALQPLSLPAGKNFELRAGQRLINRTLILEQMKSQGMVKQVSDEDVQKDLDLLRKQIPACVQYRCETDAGWAQFLDVHNLTLNEVTARWRQRMQILSFIDTRFRAGVRISKADVEAYYKNTLTQQFQEQHVNPPPLDSMSSRIEEVLLQQHVSVLLQDWLKALRDQGNVVILDPALGPSNPSAEGDDEGEGV